MIWCSSLFSHLPADRWPAFLEFFETCLRPWGLLVFATSGRNQVTAETADDFRRGGFVYRDDTAVASPAWVCEQLGARPGLRLIGYTERGWHQEHDVVACARVGPRVQVNELRAAQPSITDEELIEATGYDESTILTLLEGPQGSPAP